MRHTQASSWHSLCLNRCCWFKPHRTTPVVAALYFIGDGTLYGRYWGSTVDYDCLHFEACYCQGIEFSSNMTSVASTPVHRASTKLSADSNPFRPGHCTELQTLGSNRRSRYFWRKSVT